MLRMGLLAAIRLVLMALGLNLPAQAVSKADADKALKAAHDTYKTLKEGKNADYIPALAKVNSKFFGIGLVTVDGQVSTTGDVDQLFSIQSISKGLHHGPGHARIRGRCGA
jgi:glutaminase